MNLRMNQLSQQLTDWGFSSQWWRGKRGEYWFLGQTLLSVAFILLPAYAPRPLLASVPLAGIRWGLAIAFGLVSVLFLVWGTRALGNSLTPLPQPKATGEFVNHGLYSWVRHPIYSGVIFGAIAYASARWSLSHLLGAVVLLVFFDLKARQEETWLRQKYSDYAAYQSRVKKLIPFLY